MDSSLDDWENVFRFRYAYTDGNDSAEYVYTHAHESNCISAYLSFWFCWMLRGKRMKRWISLVPVLFKI